MASYADIAEVIKARLTKARRAVSRLQRDYEDVVASRKKAAKSVVELRNSRYFSMDSFNFSDKQDAASLAAELALAEIKNAADIEAAQMKIAEDSLRLAELRAEIDEAETDVLALEKRLEKIEHASDAEQRKIAKAKSVREDVNASELHAARSASQSRWNAS